MALTFGQLASGAGAVSTGMRQAEEAERVARQNQLRIEEQNRANQAAQEIQAARAGLQVPAMPNFTGGTGGQQFGIPQAAPAAPAAPAAQALPVNMNAPQAVPIPAIAPSDMDAGGFPLGAAAPTPVAPTPAAPAPAADGTSLGNNELTILGIPTGRVAVLDTPFGRSLDAGIGKLNERQERDALRTRLNYKYGPAAGFGGLFVAQTDEQRKQAQEIMDRLPTLSTEELRQLEATGQLPPKATPQAGVKEPTAPAAEEPLTTTQGSQPRSVRNNNPGNLVFNEYTKSLGATGKDKDGFAIFPDPQIGQQASIANLQNYGTKGINTVSAITNRWSPPNAPGNTKQSTDNYTAYVAAKLGVDPNQPLDMNDTQMLAVMAEAISEFESGHTSPLVGRNPGQTADRVATAAAAPATSGMMFGPTEVAGGAQNPGVQSALMLRQTLASEYEIYNRNRMFGQADAALAQIAAIDLGLYKAQADLGIYELSTSGDASRAMSVLSQFTGTPTQALSRGDGMYDLYQNGRVTQTAVPVDKLADLIKTTIDAEYRASKTALAAERSGELFKKDLELRNKIREEVVKAQGNISKAATEGRFKLLEKQYDVEIKPDTASGTVVVRKGDKISYFDPRATTEIRGEQVPASRLIPVR